MRILNTIQELIKHPQSSASRKITQKIGFGFLIFTAVITVLPIFAIVIYILIRGFPAITWTFLTKFPSEGMRQGGIIPAIIGTFYLTIGTAIFSVPLGIGAAIYLSEYAPDNRWTRVVSISVGATRWQTIRRIVLPQSLPGIITGVILGLERAAGETAPILFTAASFFLPRLPNSPLDPTMALPYHLFVISTQVPGMPVKIQYGTALVLIAFVLGMNLIASSIRSRARAHRQW